MKKLFDNNRFLIVFAVAAALLLYTMVSITTNDSRTSTIYSVPITLDLTSAALVNQRLSLVDEAAYFVDIEVFGPLSAIDDLTDSSPELATTVDLARITEPGPVTLPLISAYGGENELPFEIRSYSPATIELAFDRQTSKDFAVKPVVNGISFPPSPSFVLDSEYTSPGTVRVTGPENELARVKSAEVEYELTEPLTANFAEDLPVILKDVQGNPIDPAEHHLTLSTPTVQLVLIVLVETELPLKVEFLTPPRGFPVDQLMQYMTLSDAALAVAGPEAVIDTVTEIVVAYLDLSALGLSDTSYTFPIDLTEEELKNIENVKSVKVSFDAADWSSALINISNINLVSPPADYEVELISDRIDNVEFIGLPETLDTLTADDIVAEVNLSERELTPGRHTFPVKISAPGKGMVWAVGDYSVMIEVKEKEPA